MIKIYNNLPYDIQLLILNHLKELVNKEINIIKQFHFIPPYDIYHTLNKMIIKYSLLTDTILLKKIKNSFKYDSYTLLCLKELIEEYD